VGTVQFAMRLAPADFYEMIKRFGFGRKTGIGLSSESPGFVRPVAAWKPRTSISHLAIGYELRATPLQILRAMNVFATRGRLVQPRIVADPPDVTGVSPEERVAPVRILDRRLADDLVIRALEKVVERGTGKQGRLDGYHIAGKTGTARFYDPALGNYSSRRYIASFTGFVPAGRPALSMVVVLADPNEGFIYGGQICAPVFRDIARLVLRYLGVPPDETVDGRIVTAEMKRKDRP
jgi:cell division protein FtsI/penicillin-binding protein 2